MEASGYNGSPQFDEEQALKVLLDAFGPSFSIEEIASAYCKAGKNPDAAAETLALSASSADVARPSGEKSSSSRNVNKGNGNVMNSKTKCPPASMGSVSSVRGRHDGHKGQTANGSANVDKPLKIYVPQSWLEKDDPIENSDASIDDLLHQDMENLLFKGFSLERGVIRQVLESCGYDMFKSIEKLNTLSRNALKSEVSSQASYINNSQGNGDKTSNTSRVDCDEWEKKRLDLQKQVLVDLFNAEGPMKTEPKKKIERARNGYSAYGNLVLHPPRDSLLESNTPMVYQQRHTEDDADDEDSYEVLRKKVKEYRSTMKDYYQAAVDAFSKDDRVRASNLLEQGHFFLKKAREADEESNKMITNPGNGETEGDIVLDLHEGGAKEAIRLLKCHLNSFSGIASIKHLKLIVDTSEKDISKASRRRLAVLKLLEEESIKWAEVENAGTLRIQLDCINPKKLSFYKK